MIRLPLSQLGKWDHGQKDMKKRRRWRREKLEWRGEAKSTGNDGGGASCTRPWGGRRRKRKRENNNNRGWRIKRKTMRNKRSQIESNRRGEMGWASWGRTRAELVFQLYFSPNTRHCGHLSDTLSSLANMSSRNISVEDGKIDCVVFFFVVCFFKLGIPARLSLPVQVRKPPHPICHVVSRGQPQRQRFGWVLEQTWYSAAVCIVVFIEIFISNVNSEIKTKSN